MHSAMIVTGGGNRRSAAAKSDAGIRLNRRLFGAIMRHFVHDWMRQPYGNEDLDHVNHGIDLQWNLLFSRANESLTPVFGTGKRASR